MKEEQVTGTVQGRVFEEEETASPKKGVASPRNCQRTSWPEPAHKRGQVSRFQDDWRSGRHSDGRHEFGFSSKGNGELFVKRYK